MSGLLPLLDAAVGSGCAELGVGDPVAAELTAVDIAVVPADPPSPASETARSSMPHAASHKRAQIPKPG
jgi:hypothetical protein